MSKETEKTEVQDRSISDEEIVALYWKRDERAIRETDDKYGHYLYTLAYNIVHDRMDSEECVNDTYLGTWNCIPPTRPRVFVNFISKLVRNLAVDCFRKTRAQRRIPTELTVSLEELDECIPAPEEGYLDKTALHLAELLSEFLREQTSRGEFIFICRYYYCDSVENIAKMLGVGKTTVYREIRALRKDLKERLQKEGYRYE